MENPVSVVSLLPYKVLQEFSYEGVSYKVGLVGLTPNQGRYFESLGGLVEAIKPTMIDHVVSQADLDLNPELVEEGVQIGETIGLPMYDREVLKAIGVDVDGVEAEYDKGV